MDLLILKHGQVTRTAPELARFPSLNYPTTPMEGPPLSTDPASSSSQLTEPSNEEEEVKYLFSLEILLPTQYVEGDLFERVYVNCPLLSILRNDGPSSSGAPTEASNDEPSSYGAPTEASNDEVQYVCSIPAPAPNEYSIVDPHIITRVYLFDPSTDPTDVPVSSRAPIEPLNEDDDDVIFLRYKTNSTSEYYEIIIQL
ncbi:uncharacterized protein TNCV_4563132 [Trichonephila clavipes]|uniref:Uncharacterized protein n=1 Tax=Trichonephila clavipes TaxID=2585209 RepID=A0A8X7BDU9_TRICX|nr:uncharacterized protein TNCV_4563132 [Trichonephila clavipes]